MPPIAQIKRLEATHFIEQYNSPNAHHFGELHPLENLKKATEYTRFCYGLKTVAIFKIKFKNQ